MSDPADIIEIRDPEIDVKAIMVKIREGIESRRSIYEEDVFFPSFSVTDPSSAGARHLSKEFSYELQEALDCHDQTWISKQFEARPFPVIGAIVARLRDELHNLVLFYVNLLAAKQVTFNSHAIRSTAKLSEIVASKADTSELAQLREELAQLRGKIENLEEELANTRNSLAEVEGVDVR